QFEANLKDLFLELFYRAAQLGSRGATSSYVMNQKTKLWRRVWRAYEPLLTNPLLRFFALRLLEKFAVEGGTETLRQRRLETLSLIGFGKDDGKPIEAIQMTREAIAQHPFYRFNLNVQDYFFRVAKDPGEIAETHALLRRFHNLPILMTAMDDDEP